VQSLSLAVAHQQDLTHRVLDGTHQLDDASTRLEEFGSKLRTASNALEKQISEQSAAVQRHKEEERVLKAETTTHFETIATLRTTLTQLKEQETSLSLEKRNVQKQHGEQLVLAKKMVARGFKYDQDQTNLATTRTELSSMQSNVESQRVEMNQTKHKTNSMNEKKQMLEKEHEKILFKIKQTVETTTTLSKDIDHEETCTTKLSHLNALLNEEDHLVQHLRKLKDRVLVFQTDRQEREKIDQKQLVLNEKRNQVNESYLQIESLQHAIRSALEKRVTLKRDAATDAGRQYQNLVQNQIKSFDNMDSHLKTLMEQYGE
jgi:uncharacterized protein (UPF0262 family)